MAFTLPAIVRKSFLRVLLPVISILAAILLSMGKPSFSADQPLISERKKTLGDLLISIYSADELEKDHNLGQISKAVEKLDEDICEAAVKALRNMKPQKPQTVQECLLKMLEHWDWRVRLAAAQVLGSLGDEKPISSLIELTGDSHPMVRKAAAESLEKMGEPLGMLILETLKGSWSSLGELSTRKDPRCVVPLIKALDNFDPDISKMAAWTLFRIGDPQALMPCIAALQKGVSEVRQAAAWTLMKIGDKRAVDPLITALEDRVANVRAAAAWALSEIGDQRAVDPLIRLLQDPHTELRQASAWALKTIRDKRSVEPLTIALQDSQPGVRRAAVLALGDIGERGSFDSLRVASMDRYSDVREAAAYALRATGHKRAFDLLVKLMDDEASGVRQAAIWNLALIGDLQAVDRIIPALRDMEPEVRKSAADALEKLGEPLGRLILGSLSGSRRDIDGLAKLKDPRTVDSLVLFLHHKDPDLRKSAKQVLISINDVQAVRRLVEMSRGWHPKDRIVGMQILLKIKQEKFVDYLHTAYKILFTTASLSYLLCAFLLFKIFFRLSNRPLRFSGNARLSGCL